MTDGENDGEYQDGEWLYEEFPPLLKQCNPLPATQTIGAMNFQLRSFLSIPNQRCVEIKIPMNYKPIDIEIENQNVTHLMITDQKLTSCDENQFRNCPVGSTVCISKKSNCENCPSPCLPGCPAV